MINPESFLFILLFVPSALHLYVNSDYQIFQFIILCLLNLSINDDVG